MVQRPSCPHCGSISICGHGTFRWKNGTSRRRYLCRSCGRTFSHHTGTPLYYVKKREEWVRQSSGIGEGLSLRAMASLLGVAVATAFRWRHSLLDALSVVPQQRLTGNVGVAEAYVSYSEKGSRITRGPGSYGVAKASEGRTWWDGHKANLKDRFRRLKDGKSVCVLFGSNGTQYAARVVGQGRPSQDTLEEHLPYLVGPRARLWGKPAYAQVCKQLGIPHIDVYQHRVALRSAPVSGAHLLCRGLYCWMLRFRGVATRYLSHYVVWYRFICGAGTRRSTRPGQHIVHVASHLVRPSKAA